MKGKPGEPVLISWKDATTLFHEFGHALHGLSSNVTYPSLAGTAVARDYVEFPSQLLEHWLSTPEILNRYALHYQTGKPIPPRLVDQDRGGRQVQPGLRHGRVPVERAGRHEAAPGRATRRSTRTSSSVRRSRRSAMPAEIVMRHRTPQFSHVFSGDGYSAGYYSYLWSDTITADAWEAFTEAGGAWDKAVAKRLELRRVARQHDRPRRRLSGLPRPRPRHRRR